MNHNEVIERALIHIEDHLQHSLTVESVANAFNMSKYYFHRLFSAMMGCTLSQYILSRRLNASLTLILDKNNSLTDIAYRLNFGTQASFTRAFKRQYGTAPSSVKAGITTISPIPIPTVVNRPIKNINGDIVADFTLTEFEKTRISGIAFEVDLANDDYKKKIRAHSEMLLSQIDETINGPCYVIYSNCQPDSTRFKVLFGIPSSIEIDEPYYFTVDVPQIFCARFNYCGDLLDIGDVLKSDYARFLKISRQETAETDIELIQVFEDVHNSDSAYHIYAPIKKLPADSHL
ncbi:AraC family transcriptional regulator [Paenibacillus sp. alder61]|uniref:Helix-turn-helix transcriptional regulator n=1 Tax=Paenibacillus faecis TaxID=862114 RepID=A0A5D0CRA4_9BACL|nr:MULTISPECIES: AraC family transcriptional regulator [Paenibacillus]MCA1293287.1 AraC family transcriptional regulator [Paenibacillus sp. alder61]TYA12353.1 helix-turn-helix transcriptional regulator [Paenibacillus faecis]